MTVPINSTLMKRHVLAYGYTFSNGGPTSEGQMRPLQVDANGALLTGPAQSGGNTGAFIELNSDAISSAQFAPVDASFCYGYNPLTTSWDRLYEGPSNSDTTVVAYNQGQLQTLAQLMRWNGTSFQRARGENIFHNTLIVGIGGTTAVWTPAAGKKFRLMGYAVSVAATLAAAAPVLIKFQDGAGAIILQLQVSVQTALGQDSQPSQRLGDGILSALANNALNIVTNNAAAFVTGGIAVNVWGTEE